MKSVTIPKDAYDKLLARARLGERVLALSQKYPLEDYTDARIEAFLREDRVTRSSRRNTSRRPVKKRG